MREGGRSGNGEAASACEIADSCVLTFLSAVGDQAAGAANWAVPGPARMGPRINLLSISLSPLASLSDLLLWIGSPEEEREFREGEGG